MPTDAAQLQESLKCLEALAVWVERDPGVLLTQALAGQAGEIEPTRAGYKRFKDSIAGADPKLEEAAAAKLQEALPAMVTAELHAYKDSHMHTPDYGVKVFSAMNAVQAFESTGALPPKDATVMQTAAQVMGKWGIMPHEVGARLEQVVQNPPEGLEQAAKNLRERGYGSRQGMMDAMRAPDRNPIVNKALAQIFESVTAELIDAKRAERSRAIEAAGDEGRSTLIDQMVAQDAAATTVWRSIGSPQVIEAALPAEFAPPQASSQEAHPYPPIILVDKTGKVTKLESPDTVPEGCEWAKLSLEKMQREMEQIRKECPELLDAFNHKKGQMVFTEGDTGLFVRHVVGQKDYQLTGQVATTFVLTDGSSVVGYNCDSYPSHSQEAYLKNGFVLESQVTAHEITHAGDDTRLENSKPVSRLHSSSNLFKACIKLDEIFNPMTGIAAHTSEVVARAYDNAIGTYLLETLPRAVEHMLTAPESEVSPLLRAYVQEVYMLDKRYEAKGDQLHREALREAINSSIGAIVGEEVFACLQNLQKAEQEMQANLENGMSPQLAGASYRLARHELGKMQGQVEGELLEYMSGLERTVEKIADRMAEAQAAREKVAVR